MKDITLQQMIDCVLAQGNEDWYIRDNLLCNTKVRSMKKFIRKVVLYGDADAHKKIQDIIRQLLKSSGKSNLPIDDLFELMDVRRLTHTVLCYLYGCYIYNCDANIKNYIDTFVEKIWTCKTQTPKSKFLLTWMLVSLFHDVGYSIENDDTDGIVVNRILTFYGVPNILDLNNGIKTLIPSFVDLMPKCYKDIPMNYDKYRKIQGIIKYEKPTYDHGIYGGLLLNQALCKFPEKFGMPKQYYQHIAWVIMCHNMWFAQEENSKYVYRVLGMDSLCVSQETYQILAEKHPLLWLLSVVDNIECTKKRVSVKWLKEISIVVFSQHELKIHVSKKACKGKNVNQYIKSVSGLNDWLIKTEVEN